MLGHLVNLLARSFFDMPGRISANWGGLWFGLTVVGLSQVSSIFKAGLLAWFAQWRANYKSRLCNIFAIQGIAWISLYCVSIFLTTYDDHSNLAAAARRIKATSKTIEQGKDSCLVTSQSKDTRIEDLLGRIQSQQQSINAQQTTINQQQGMLNGQQTSTNKCVSYLTQNSAAGFQVKVKVGYLPVPNQPQPTTIAAIVAEPNQTINPMSVNVKCAGDLKLLYVTFPNQGRGQMLPSLVPVDSHEYHVSLAYPPWESGDLLIFWAVSKRENDLGSCSVYKN